MSDEEDLLAEMEVRPGKARSGRAATTGLKQSYSNYAKIFGKSARTVKRWVKIGKEKDDPCPLDEPEKMRGWWARCMSLRCPDGILAAEIEKKGEQDPELEEREPVVLESEERGLAGALARMEQMEVKLASRADHPGQVKPWLDTIQRMSTMSERIRKEMEAQGKLAPKAEVEQVLREFLRPVESGIRGMYDTFCEVLQLPKSAALEAEWLKQCDNLFEHWGKEVFGNV